LRFLRFALGGALALAALLPCGIANAAESTTTSTVVTEGCSPEPTVQAVFLGKVLSIEDGVVRYEINQVRAGSLSGYAVEGEVDVYYDDDATFLTKGRSYIIGATPNSLTNRLSSKVRESTPLFGGAEVAGSDADTTCPKYEDPVRTLNLDGSTVESGVLTGFFSAEKRIAGSILLAVGIVFGGLFAAVVVKRSLDGASRASAKRRAQRSRSRGSRTPQPSARPRA